MAAGAYRVSVILRIEKVKKFEDEEQRLFGKDGFERMVARVADLEKSLGLSLQTFSIYP
jgi:hypothetical protein